MPRVSKLQRHILTRIADGWELQCNGGMVWLDENPADMSAETERVPMYTSERLILRNLIHPDGHLLPDGWRAIGRRP